MMIQAMTLTTKEVDGAGAEVGRLTLLPRGVDNHSGEILDMATVPHLEHGTWCSCGVKVWLR